MSQKSLIHIVNETLDNSLEIPACNEDILLLEESNIIAEPDVIKETQTPNNEGAKCIALMGAAGGVGVTSLCVQIAYELAKDTQKQTHKLGRNKEPRVCLIDLDFENGSCAHHLDIIPSASLEDLNQNPNHIDRPFVSALMTTHNSGLDILAVPNTLGGNNMANPLAVTALLDIACQMYDYVILDVPRFWSAWNMAAIAGADHFAIVTDLTIPSLHLARMRLEAIELKLAGHVKCDIVLNKYERRSFKNTLREKDAETALKREITTTICVDADTTREAINCGEPTGAIRPESRYAKDVRSLRNYWVKTDCRAKKQAA